MTQPVSVAIDQAQTRAAFTLHHPKGNIITAEMIGALRWALEAVAEHPHLKLITIEGSGADFSFGASIPEHAPGEIDRVLPEMHELIYELLDARAPTAAIVRGRCFGGGFELALACDFIFAAETATFALPEIALGVFPPAASALLPLRVGTALAARAVLTGEVTTAPAWHEAGLVHSTAADSDLSTMVEQWFATALAPRSAAALRHAAAAVRATLTARVRETLPQLERLYLDELMRTHDAAEGIEAFMAKRAPRWTDR
jgi:cyclohexa-1,5-dienecarbonyl-CoA hydratase